MSGRPRSRRLGKLVLLLTGVVLFAGGCASNAPQDVLDPDGPHAKTIDNLGMPVFAIAGVVFVLVMGGAVWVSLKFKARDDADFDEFPEQVHGNFRLEIAWTILPAVILGVVGIATVVTIFDLAQKPEPEALHVEVYGQQWWWEYRYDVDNDGNFDEIVTANDLVIPADREIALHIRSRDVIHSFWIPKLNGKKDAVPGREHPLSIEAPEPGEWVGQCTEYCGLSHAEMRIKAIALSDEDFDTWAEEQQRDFEVPADDQAVAGWSSFAGQCTTCHVIQGMTDPSSDDPDAEFEYPDVVNQVAGVAPDLTHFMSRTTFAGAKFDLRKDTEECRALGVDWASTDEGIEQCLNRNDLEAWLRNAPAMKAMAPGDTMSPNSRGMPSFDLSEDQIDQLVAFLITLQ